jgi:oligopeptide transport system permease protein
MAHGPPVRYIMKRLLLAAPTLLVLVTISFFVIRFAPGGPFDAYGRVNPAALKNLRAVYHLDAPLLEQYLRYLFGVFDFDFGTSLRYRGIPVATLILASLPTSLRLALCAIVLSLLVGSGSGIVAALWRGGWIDRITTSTASLGIIVPSVIIAPVAQFVFAVKLEWLPVSGWEGGWTHRVLPIAALSLPCVAGVARLTRASMLETLNADYVRTARAKGLGRRVTVLRHALPGGLVPLLAYLGPTFAGVVMGSVIIERVFAIPGMGRLFVEAALSRDYPLVTGIVLLYGVIIITANLLVDVAYAVVDPRVALA